MWEASLAWLSLDQKFLIFRNFASHITQIEKTQSGTRNRKLKINPAGLGVAALMQKLCHSLILNPSWWSRIHKFNYSCAVWSYLNGKLSWLLVRNWGVSHFLLQPDPQVLHVTEYYPHYHHTQICQFLLPTHLSSTSYKWNLCVQLFEDTFNVHRQNWSCTGPSKQNRVEDILKRTWNKVEDIIKRTCSYLNKFMEFNTSSKFSAKGLQM